MEHNEIVKKAEELIDELDERIFFIKSYASAAVEELRRLGGPILDGRRCGAVWDTFSFAGHSYIIEFDPSKHEIFLCDESKEGEDDYRTNIYDVRCFQLKIKALDVLEDLLEKELKASIEKITLIIERRTNRKK